ncbi:MAG: hypothetical protein WC998_06665 [Candidatus Paceibacterota bacterium]
MTKICEVCKSTIKSHQDIYSRSGEKPDICCSAICLVQKMAWEHKAYAVALSAIEHRLKEK